MKQLSFLAALVLSGNFACFAQNYNTPSARVINQSSNGLAYPSSSYIGPGTLSKTAQQGAGYTPPNNPNLPKVNHGAYLGTPGDNLYSGNPDLSHHPQSVNMRRPSRIIYKPAPQESGKIYVPNPNIPMNYSDYKAEPTSKSEINVVPANIDSNPGGAESKKILAPLK